MKVNNLLTAAIGTCYCWRQLHYKNYVDCLSGIDFSSCMLCYIVILYNSKLQQNILDHVPYYIGLYYTTGSYP
jgi:hypothetical protein